MNKRKPIVPTVDEIKIIEARGPWKTKSDGNLNVLFGIHLGDVQQFLSYDIDEIDKLPRDIRGLRSYIIRDLPERGIGGDEWHRIRQEMIFAPDGSVRWTCVDLLGGTRNFVLNSRQGIWIPPFILHTYEVKEAGSSLLVFANTLFFDDPKTHDTYSKEMFFALQAEHLRPT